MLSYLLRGILRKSIITKGKIINNNFSGRKFNITKAKINNTEANFNITKRNIIKTEGKL